MGRGAVREKSPRDSGSQFSLWQFAKQQMRDRAGDSGGLLQGGQPGNIKGYKHYNSALSSVLTRNGFRVKMLDTSWQRLSRHDVSNIQQFVEFDESYLENANAFAEFGAFELDAAIRNLKYDISIDSKENLPHSLEEKLNLFLLLYDRGLINGDEFYKQTGITISPETREKVKLASADWIVGINPQEEAAMQAQTQQGIEQLLNAG